MGIWVTVPGLLLLYFLTDVLAVAPLARRPGAARCRRSPTCCCTRGWGTSPTGSCARRGHRRRADAARLRPAARVRRALRRARRADRRPGRASGSWSFFIAGNLLFAAYQVPYLSTPADLRIGYHERTRLMGFRMVVLTLGILLSGVLAPLITGGDDPTRGGYALMGVVLAAAMLVAMLVGVAGVRRLARRRADHRHAARARPRAARALRRAARPAVPLAGHRLPG